MQKPKQNVLFRTIDLERHRETVCRFRKDTDVVSFGSEKQFRGPDGHDVDRFIVLLSERIRAYPVGHVHAWLDGKIIGQIEARPRTDLLPDKQAVGYVGLYYIAPQWRGMGYGAMLQDYVESWFRTMECPRLLLSVSPTNSTAWAFYIRQGWKDCGPRPGRPEVHLMEKWLHPKDTPT